MSTLLPAAKAKHEILEEQGLGQQGKGQAGVTEAARRGVECLPCMGMCPQEFTNKRSKKDTKAAQIRHEASPGEPRLTPAHNEGY